MVNIVNDALYVIRSSKKLDSFYRDERISSLMKQSSYFYVVRN